MPSMDSGVKRYARSRGNCGSFITRVPSTKSVGMHVDPGTGSGSRPCRSGSTKAWSGIGRRRAEMVMVGFVEDGQGNTLAVRTQPMYTDSTEMDPARVEWTLARRLIWRATSYELRNAETGPHLRPDTPAGRMVQALL